MINEGQEDVLLEAYILRNPDIRRRDVAEKLGMSPGFISRQHGRGKFYLRLSGTGRILGHYIFKDIKSEIPRRRALAKARRDRKNKRIKDVKAGKRKIKKPPTA